MNTTLWLLLPGYTDSKALIPLEPLRRGLYSIDEVFILLQVLQLLSQLRKEFNASRDERVLPLLERFHHGHRLVLQLLEESLKGGVKKGDEKPNVPAITRTLASGSESGDVSAIEEGCGSDTDVFDTVTQLDDETGNVPQSSHCF